MADYDRRGPGGGSGSSYNPKKRRYRGEFGIGATGIFFQQAGITIRFKA